MSIYSDRIEIYNPGAFPEGFEPQDFIKWPERPIRRNPKIARILYYSKDIESFGTGLKRIADVCEKTGVRYEFKMLKSGFVVCFYRDWKSKSTDKIKKSTDKIEKSTDKIEKSTDKIEKSTDKIEEVQVKIIEYISKKGRITNRELQTLLGVKESRALKLLKELVNKDIIEKHGNLKGTYYTKKK